MTSVCDRPHYKGLFEDQSNLQSICEKVIVPNMEFRDADEEEFEDNPEEYIRRDIEGSGKNVALLVCWGFFLLFTIILLCQVNTVMIYTFAHSTKQVD